jgi:uncharacterized membrane protein
VCKDWNKVQRGKRVFITALFSSIIFITNFFVPPPISNLLIVVQAVMLALASLFVGKLGATYVGLTGGVLSALSRPAFGPFTFLFTFLFGVLVDVFFVLFRVDTLKGEVSVKKVMAAMAFSTAIIGFLSYYIIAVNPYPHLIELTPSELTPMMSGLVLFVAFGSGITAGYAAAYLWNKYLKNIAL